MRRKPVQRRYKTSTTYLSTFFSRFLSTMRSLTLVADYWPLSANWYRQYFDFSPWRRVDTALHWPLSWTWSREWVAPLFCRTSPWWLMVERERDWERVPLVLYSCGSNLFYSISHVRLKEMLEGPTVRLTPSRVRSPCSWSPPQSVSASALVSLDPTQPQ